MSVVVVTTKESEQVELVLPDGKLIKILVTKRPNRKFYAQRMVIIADENIRVRRSPREPKKPRKELEEF